MYVCFFRSNFFFFIYLQVWWQFLRVLFQVLFFSPLSNACKCCYIHRFLFSICWNFHLVFKIVFLFVCLCVCVVVKVSMLQFVLNLENCVLFLFSGVLAAHQQSLHFTVVTRAKGGSRRAWMCVIDDRGCCVGWLGECLKYFLFFFVAARFSLFGGELRFGCFCWVSFML